MATSALAIAVYAGLVLWVHHGPYSPTPARAQRPRRELVEAGLLVAVLLLVRWVHFDLLGYSGWLSAYLVLGLLAPPILELLVRRRPLTVVGFRRPGDGRAVAITLAVLGLYLAAGLLRPLLLRVEYQFEPRRMADLVVFVWVEEVLFRGLLQTRLESALGPVWAWLGSGLVFGLYHLYVHFLAPGRAVTALNLVQIGMLTTLGMLLGVVFAKTRSLLPPFLIHAVHNLFAVYRW